MKKIIKLIILAAVLIGAVIGLMYVIAPDSGNTSGPTLTSAQANEWKAQINQLCEKGNWSREGYNAIESGVHTERVTSGGDLISMDEENALQNYLFTTSCNSLNEQVNELFRQSSYPASGIRSAEDMLAFLSGRLENFGTNSNLTEASALLSEYHQLMRSLSFSSAASYSRPLRAFNVTSAEAMQNRIRSLKHYNSHFRNNPTIVSQVNNLGSNRAKAEYEYYDNLERAIERHSKSTQDLNELLDDEIQFRQISSNSSAVARLSNFVNNPDRWL